MLINATYEIELRLDGVLIGNIREYAQNLKWERKRTRIGVDSISFTVNDMLFARWCEMRGASIAEILKPLALDARVIRNGVPVIGGYLATMPAYQPSGTSANLKLKFDGYLNYLSKVYLHPSIKTTGKMGALVQAWITIAEQRAINAGKGFNFRAGNISDMDIVQSSFQNYKSVKDAISDRCDNTSGAGPFDVFFHPDRTYDVIKDADFGDTITDYIIQYPTRLSGISATSISAKEVTGFASTVIGIGGGDISENQAEDTAIMNTQTNSGAVMKYGYAETILQNSSVSTPEVLARSVATELSGRSTMVWQPELKLSGRTINPIPAGSSKLWIGDRVTLQNAEDYTGMTSGEFRVDSLSVSVDANGAETITPSLSRGRAVNNNSFAKDIVRMQNEILALKTAYPSPQ